MKKTFFILWISILCWSCQNKTKASTNPKRQASELYHWVMYESDENKYMERDCEEPNNQCSITFTDDDNASLLGSNLEGKMLIISNTNNRGVRLYFDREANGTIDFVEKYENSKAGKYLLDEKSLKGTQIFHQKKYEEFLKKFHKKMKKIKK